MAERVGFEPTWRDEPPIRFRVGAVMTASVPLRGNFDNAVAVRNGYFNLNKATRPFSH